MGIIPYTPNFERQMHLAVNIMQEDQELLHQLAQ
jgi:hypothetical protein